MPKTSAWKYCAIPISLPSLHTLALFETFWALNGATLKPRFCKALPKNALMRDFPASELVPKIEILRKQCLFQFFLIFFIFDGKTNKRVIQKIKIFTGANKYPLFFQSLLKL